MPNIIDIGVGKVVSNWGTYDGFPALFIEPVEGKAGKPGEELEEGREPQITKDGVTEDGTVLVFRGLRGAQVIIEDIEAALAHQ